MELLNTKIINTLNKEGVSINDTKLLTDIVNGNLKVKGIGMKSISEIKEYISTLDNKEVNEFSKFTAENKVKIAKLYTSMLKDYSTRILEGNTIKEYIEKEIKQARLHSLADRQKLSALGFRESLNTEIVEKEFSKVIKEYSEEAKKVAWSYRKWAIRLANLQSLLNGSKKKINNRLIDSFITILKLFIEGGNSVSKYGVSAASIVGAVSSKLKVTDIILKDGTRVDANKESQLNVSWQYIAELCSLDYLDMKLKTTNASRKANMVTLPKWINTLFTEEDSKVLKQCANYLKLNSLYVDMAEVDMNKLTTQGSWYYKTPKHPDEYKEFLEHQQSIKYSFVPNAKEALGQKYLSHLTKGKCDRELKDYELNRIRYFNSQISDSNNNGGHYHVLQNDSVGRLYVQGEIGHKQLSSDLRSLVKIGGIENPIKYDMTNNVIQMYSLVLGSRNLAQYVGLLPIKTGDLREVLARELTKELGIKPIGKEEIKPLFMVWAYSAGWDTIYRGKAEKQYDQFTGEYYYEKVDGLSKYTQGIDEEIVKTAWNNILARLLPEVVWLKSVFKELNYKNPFTIAEWVLPDGFIAQYAAVPKKESRRDIHLEAVDSSGDKHTNTQSIKELVSGEGASGLLPRVIHSFDAYVMRRIVSKMRKLGAIVVPNHDSFTFDKKYEKEFIQIAKEVYCEFITNNKDKGYFSDVVRQLNKTKCNLNMKDSKGNTIKPDSFGERLTVEDVKAGMPVDLEDL